MDVEMNKTIWNSRGDVGNTSPALFGIEKKGPACFTCPFR